MGNRYFDLNIEKVLDNWEIHHAIREIIANALDETVLAQTEEPRIFKDGEGFWHIRDYGRGLNYEHFTQNQNAEKLDAANVIGKFGVGLKDALAVLNRAGRDVQIDSKYGHITLAMHDKEGFSDVQTLHAVFESPVDDNFVGTEFKLDVSDEEVAKAKQLFLYFENKMPLDTTTYGEIYAKSRDSASIYVNGVKVAEEENYTFDYNITKQNAALKKALNRERSFLGRTAYSGTVKNMLLNASALDVISKLLEELKKIPVGTEGDEIHYLDVQVYAVKKYNALKPSLFMSQFDQYQLTEDDKERIRESGRELVTVPDAVYERIRNDTDENGNQIGTMEVVQQEYSQNFEYHFVKTSELTQDEATIWATKDAILKYLGLEKYRNQIKISTTINDIISGDTKGVFDSDVGIVLKREVLSDRRDFSEVLIHELIHATTGYRDSSRDFENTLGQVIGKLAVDVLRDQESTASKVKQNPEKIQPKTIPRHTDSGGGLFGWLFKKK